MEQPTYFPDIWEDDVQMAGLMSMIKERRINPVDYERKIKFWSVMIGRYCDAVKDPIINVNILKKRFRRGDQIPGSLDIVIDHLKKKGDLIEVEEYNGRNKSWVEWGYSRVIGSIWNQNNVSSLEFVYLPTIKKQAKEIVDFYHSEYSFNEEMSNEIIGAHDFFTHCSHIVANERVYNLVLMELVNQGELTIGNSRTGEKVLKFRYGTHKGPIQWTESDASVLDVRRAMKKLEVEIKRLEEKAKKAEIDARQCVRNGDRSRAAHNLRQKKRMLKEIESKDIQYQKLLDMLYQLGQTKQNKEIIDAYKAGANAFKATLQREGISPDQIDETMDSIHDAMATADEIHEALGAGAQSNISNKELEAELDSLLSEGEHADTSILNDLPEVPVHGFEGILVEQEGSNQDLARRLQRLREG